MVIRLIPQGFIVKNKKVSVLIVVMDQLHPNLIFRVGERAINPILTTRYTARVTGTELGLVLLQTVELLHFVVTFLTTVSIGAFKLIILILCILNFVFFTCCAVSQRSLK